jgi:hypothetical protein
MNSRPAKNKIGILKKGDSMIGIENMFPAFSGIGNFSAGKNVIV